MARPDHLAFSGSWERRGLVSVPVIDDAPGTPQPAAQYRPPAAQQPAVPGHRATYRTEICECGCMVVIGEPCPVCLPWAQADAVRASWRAEERRNRRAAS